MTTNLKTFCIYTTDDTLYIKNSDNPPKKLAYNIKHYCVSFDSNDRINICTIDNKGRLAHFFYSKGSWRKYILGKFLKSTDNIQNLRMHIIDNYFNVFITQQSYTSNDIYKITHLNFSTSNYKVITNKFDAISKDDDCIYKLSIDDLSNIELSYYEKSLSSSVPIENKVLFNYLARKWIPFNSTIHMNDAFFNTNAPSVSIQNNIFDYLYSIKYYI